MSSVDKFGRPLNTDKSQGKPASFMIQGIRLDDDNNYTAVGKRLKMLAEPIDETDAVNLSWVNKQLASLQEFLEVTIRRTQEHFQQEVERIKSTPSVPVQNSKRDNEEKEESPIEAIQIY